MKNMKFGSLAMGIAFVGFITQFGGGFASGAQIYQYFINYGVLALLTPIIAQGILALLQWVGMRYAFRQKTYDYRSFSDKFYGKTRIVFSNLYEAIYFIMVCLAPAVAFATGGATLNSLTGIPYLLCTFIIGVIIFALTIFGSDLIRKFSVVFSIIVIVGLLAILIPNIIVQWDTIREIISSMNNGEMAVGSVSDGSAFSAVKGAVIYGVFHLAQVGMMYQHVKDVKDEKEIGRSMLYMFIISTVIMELMVVGLIAVAYNSELSGNSVVPMLLLVQSGVGAKIFTPIISVLIILGAVSTGVNMIAGIVERSVKQIEKERKPRRRVYIIASLIFTFLAFAIAQFGLMPLVKTGYTYIGYLTLIALVIPFVFCFIKDIIKKKGAVDNGIK